MGVEPSHLRVSDGQIPPYPSPLSTGWAGVGRMRVVGVLIATCALAGCESGGAVSDHQSGQVSEVEKKEQLRAVYERQRVALTREGQGCPGRVLRDQDLRNTVAGKREVPPVEVSDGPHGRSYHADGRLETGLGWGNLAVGRYWIANDDLCHDIRGAGFGEGEVPWCIRLIRSSDGRLMEEQLIEQTPRAVRLACAPLQLMNLEPRPRFAPKHAAPSNSPGGWITSDDYPPEALAGRIEGSVVYRVAVTVDGRVSSCELARTSGNRALDQATCRLVTDRARFEPATDGDGSRTVGSFTGRVIWTVPN
jgi:TonB family protein